jgi:nodulation protein E
MTDESRVVVTGLGIIAPIGSNVSAFRDALQNGTPGIRAIKNIAIDALSTKIAAEVTGFEPLGHFTSNDLMLLDRSAQLALVAAAEAVKDSGLDASVELGPRAAVVIGSGFGGATTIEESYFALFAEGRKRFHPYTVPKIMINAPASHISMRFGITGPSFAVASACASSNQAISQAFQLVRAGIVDVAITGGVEACLTAGSIRAWEALRVLTLDNCRPFSADRSGLVLGEGAALFVIESIEHARNRGANIHAEILGVGASSDAGNILTPTLKGPVAAIKSCLSDAKIEPEQVDYINAHGTGTVTNDATETKAIHAVFRESAKKLCISSTKSMHGHALGGAGAIELMGTILAIRDGFLPPTINFTKPDPECDLDYVPNEARQKKLRVALSNSFAFGGHNSVIAVRSPEYV